MCFCLPTNWLSRHCFKSDHATLQRCSCLWFAANSNDGDAALFVKVLDGPVLSSIVQYMVVQCSPVAGPCLAANEEQRSYRVYGRVAEEQFACWLSSYCVEPWRRSCLCLAANLVMGPQC